ncbi:transcription termination factor Rho [Nocardioides dongxiaopingii]|nr:transcription termination factor Rho [Nocardioides sp. S-1144]QCW50525.1 transcription termination factor Rho [Nocardioides sp. S-1144]
MTETPDTAPTASAKKRTGGLSAMLLADLKSMAGGMGIAGAGSMKKAQLIDAIKGAQASAVPGGSGGSGDGGAAPAAARRRKPAAQAEAQAELPVTPSEETAAPARERQPRRRREQDPAAGAASTEPQRPGSAPAEAQPAEQRQPEQDQAGSRRSERQAERQADREADRQDDRPDDRQSDRQGEKKQGKQNQVEKPEQKPAQKSEPRPDQQSDQGDGDGDGEGRTGRNRRRRGRDRNRVAGDAGGQGGGQGGQGGAPASQGPKQNAGNQGNQGNQGKDGGGQGGGHRHEPDTTILEDDVVVPAAGILDVLDNYAFVRTSGYLPGADDVYLSLSMVRKFGLRRGDAIVGQVRQPREGERREKFNPMVRIDSVNGHDPEQSRSRADFDRLTALYPSERLRLETESANLVGRVVDVVAPIGKGQRGLVVAPARSGRTTVLQSIAQSVSVNNPECHLMVVLVDERPEEVTDYERSVKGEVISSTFDRPAGDHTVVAELAIERAKRLVELGHDVVVLLDGLTRLARAYHHSTPASGRLLAGGVDAAALHPTKKFFGAARNIENGGSLTIIATAVVESGSVMDEVIFEEFAGTGNMELRLRRDLADKRVFPAIDPVQSGTRREELLMSEEELAIVWKLRRVLSNLDGQQALELLLERLRRAGTNIEFLMNVQKATPKNGQAAI